MPELPELEVLRQSIESTLIGRTIVEVTVNRKECVNVPPEEYASTVSGGTGNSAQDDRTTVGGGQNNRAGVAQARNVDAP